MIEYLAAHQAVSVALWISLSFITACVALAMRRKKHGFHPDDGAAFAVIMLIWPLIAPIAAMVLIFYAFDAIFDNAISPLIDKLAGTGKEQ